MLNAQKAECKRWPKFKVTVRTTWFWPLSPSYFGFLGVWRFDFSASWFPLANSAIFWKCVNSNNKGKWKTAIQFTLLRLYNARAEAGLLMNSAKAQAINLSEVIMATTTSSWEIIHLRLVYPSRIIHDTLSWHESCFHTAEWKALREIDANSACWLYVVRRSQKFSSHRRPPSRGRGTAKI